MKFSHVPIQAVAMVMVVLHLFLFPLVHAHGLAFVEPGGPHASDIVCLATDADAGHDSTEDAGHDSTGDHHGSSGICHPDTPFVVTHSQSHAVTQLIVELSPSYAGRLLLGYPRPLYIPPRNAA
ncbi:hypothetical protein GeomeDRAFT_2530 [Geobacter metallireducens RCH3]|nr:hypothetical protein [Geobacter metallireducens]EHP85364.1 hypothetical protein GeomeDRAFT_2530 [Geobacter metallireducens RCH3]